MPFACLLNLCESSTRQVDVCWSDGLHVATTPGQEIQVSYKKMIAACNLACQISKLGVPLPEPAASRRSISRWPRLRIDHIFPTWHQSCCDRCHNVSAVSLFLSLSLSGFSYNWRLNSGLSCIYSREICWLRACRYGDSVGSSRGWCFFHGMILICNLGLEDVTSARSTYSVGTPLP